jgi:hypothetical protein
MKNKSSERGGTNRLGEECVGGVASCRLGHRFRNIRVL